MRESLSTSDAPAPVGPYSQIIKANGFVFLAGQGPFDAATGALVSSSFEEQCRHTFTNLDTLARAAGSSLANAVRVGVYLFDLAHFEPMNGIFREFFSPPFPARTTIQSNIAGFLIEVDAILVDPGTSRMR